ADMTLAHDVAIAQQRVNRALGYARADIDYVAGDLDQLLRDPPSVRTPARRDSVALELRDFLRHTPHLFAVKVIDRAASVVVEASALEGVEPGVSSGVYYSYLASDLPAGQHRLLPVELRGPDDAAGRATTVAAIANIAAIRDTNGEYLGAVVGEGLAASLLAGIEDGSPSLRTESGLADPEGRVLYHSNRKPEWGSLFGPGTGLLLDDVIGETEAQRLLDSAFGVFETNDGRIVAYRSLPVSPSGPDKLTFFRILPVDELYAPVREFLLRATLMALGLGPLVLLSAYLAARQFTLPIYRLADGFAQLREGPLTNRLEISTNDEFEDLADEFFDVATAMHEYRSGLEDAIEQRTQELLRTSAELEEILANSVDAIIGLDSHGKIQVWNRGAKELFGFAMHDAVGASMEELLIPEELRRGAEPDLIQSSLDRFGAVSNLRTERLTKSGDRIPVSLTQTLIPATDGRAGGMSLILRDVRAQEMLETQLRRSERIAAVSVMAAGLAHEINNPLAIIGNRLELMQKEISDTGQPANLADDLKVLEAHTTRLATVTHDLLSFARDYEEAEVVVDLDDSVRRVADMLDRTMASRGITVEIASAEAQHVMASGPAIDTVIMNLLLNARDAMGEGGTIRVEVGNSSAGASAMVSVTDEGPGISAEIRDRIFEPFFTTKGQGLGLGLAL
ncbi:MAG: PAS domain S-box protein, partial [Gemmatimonadota bacterium]|nr:PAS domain S-box protein [Gemmatimonadota bacterium]